jgi:phage terminase large subunit GpA-like protein
MPEPDVITRSEAALFQVATADPSRIIATAAGALRPPKRLRLSEWADEHFYLSAESAAEPGRWRTLPYQRGIMDAITDPAVEMVSVMKSARIGYTKILDATVGYYMHQDPCPIMIVQPTVEDAEGFSKEELAPMLRDCPVLAEIIPQTAARDTKNTILHKIYPGGSLSVVGANSGRGFRRVSRKVVLFDEVDGYPPSAGTEGDQIKLGIRRTEYYWDRKIIIGSTPLVAGASRIAELFEAGDQRRYYVPCPHCGHMDFLAFRESDRGHWMAWPKGEPERAHFVCSKCGCEIDHKHKRAMVEAGEWRADGEFKRHASFHIWAAYSYSPNATWGQLAAEFVAANAAGPEQLKTFVNTVLGETWTERGEAPEWMRIYQRREQYPVGTVPAGVEFLTAGVDVQRDRLVYEVVGWGSDRQSWSVDAGVLPGDTSNEGADGPWAKLDELLAHAYPGVDGGSTHSVLMLAVDSGDQTQTVYNWARRYPMSRVIACKGTAAAKTIIGSPSPVDVTVRGKRLSRGYKVWPVGSSIAKSELYGWLRLNPPTSESGAPHPPGFCHFPEYGEEFFRQLTAEHLVPVKKRTGFVVHEWQIIPGRENHWLDCRVYARAAAALAGLDRMAAARRRADASPPVVSQPAPESAPQPRSEPASPAEPRPQRTGGTGWLGGGRGRLTSRRGSWLNRR